MHLLMITLSNHLISYTVYLKEMIYNFSLILETKIRLVEGGNLFEGRIELFKPTYGWISVCENGWNINAANVVCRDLGFAGVMESPKQVHFYGPGSSTVILEDVSCKGNEKSLMSQCTHSGTSRLQYPGQRGQPWPYGRTCEHKQDVGVACLAGK